MSLKKAAFALGGPLALAAVLGGTVVFAQSNGDTQLPSPGMAPGQGGHHHRMNGDCPNMGGGSDSGATEDSSAATQT
jgi:hypothetical protein